MAIAPIKLEIMRILIVAPMFPPSQTARAAQMGKVAQILAEAGFELRVVAGLERGAQGRADAVREVAPFPIEYVESLFSGASAFGRALARAPDFATARFFARRGFAAAKRIVDDWRPDLALTVSTPFAAHLVGAALRSARPKLPWAVFFSDPYPGDLLPAPYFRKNVDFLILKRQVRHVLNAADGVFLTSRFAARAFENGLGVNLSEKTFVAPHVGGDSTLNLDGTTTFGGNERNSEDAKNSEDKKESEDRENGEEGASRSIANEERDFDEFSKYLVYTGSVGPERALPELLEAVRDVATKRPDAFRGLIVFDKNRNKTFQNLAKRLKCEECVDFAGLVSPNDAFRIACAASCNLTIEANMPFSPFFPSKFADCVVANKPIIAIAPDLSEIRFLTDFYRCCATARYDKNSIIDAIERVFLQNCPDVRPNEALRAHFSRRKIVEAYRVGFERTIEAATRR